MLPAIRCEPASLEREPEMMAIQKKATLIRRSATAAAMAALVITPVANAKPTPWLLIASEGEAPNRSVHYLAIDLIGTKTDLSTYDPLEAVKDGKGLQYLQDHQYASVWVVQVLENAKEPDSILYSLNIKCRQKEVQFESASAYYRDDKLETISSDAWMPLPDNWLGRVYTAACDEENVRKAFNAVVVSKAFDNLERMKPLTDLGMIYAGKYELVDYGSELPNFTWSNLWKSGTRPKYTTDKTPEELQQIKAKLDADLAQLGGKADAWQTEIGNMDAERAFITEANKTFKKNDSWHQKVFLNMVGWTEEEIANFWGPPSSSSELGGTRALNYFTENDTRQIRVFEVPVLDSNGKQIGVNQMQAQEGELSACAMTLFLKPGGSKPGYRLIDYKIRSGTNCKLTTLGQSVR
jgi:hypothetical protein